MEAAVVALDEWKEKGTLEPGGWIRASAPERRVCENCKKVRLDRDVCDC